MTSSLVGSEMCIRDSPDRVEQDCCQRPGHQSNERARCAHQYAHRGVRHSCLLYTSDAADDM
eukprot:6215161-Prorocentrum_lima.AAC.1